MSALSSLLVQGQVLSVTQVEQTLQRQVIFGGDFATNLLELNLIDENLLVEYLGRVVKLPVISGSSLLNVDPRVVKMLPWKIAHERRVVPVRLQGNTLVVAASGPMPKGALDEVAFLLGVEISVQLALEFRLAMALNQFYGIPMSGRLAALQTKYMPEFQADQPPIVPPAGQSTSLFVPAPEIGKAEPVPEAHEEASVEEPVLVVESEKEHSRVEPDSTLKFVISHANIDNTAKQVFTPPPSEPTSAARKELEPQRMLSFSEAAREIEALSDRDKILDLFFEFASQAFEFSALFIVHGTVAHGHTMTDSDRRPISAGRVSVPLDKEGMFQNVFTTHGFYLGPPGESQTDGEFLNLLERGSLANCAILPIYLRQRIILMLYGDSGGKGVRSNRVTRLAEFGRLVANAFERILLQHKFGQYRKGPVSTAPKLATTPSTAPMPVTRKKDFSAWATSPVGEEALSEDAWPEPEKPVLKKTKTAEISDEALERSEATTDPPPELETNPLVAESVKMITPADMSVQSDLTENDLYRPTLPVQEKPPLPPLNAIPDPELVKKVETLIVWPSPDSPVERPIEVSPILEETTLVTEATLQATSGKIEVAEVVSQPEDNFLPQSEPVIEPQNQPESEPIRSPAISDVPRSVHVKMDEEIEHLIERVLTRGRFDDAAANLLVEMGDDAAAKLISHFPGPLNYDRYQESSRLRRVGQHGPILKNLIMFGDSVVPHVLPLLDSFDSEIRFYATFLLSEIGGPEVLPGLVKKVFDNDRQIRAVSIDIMKRFRTYPEFRWAVQEIALVLVGATSSLEKKRQAAEILGELSDPVVIRPLAEMLGSVDGILAERCQRSLVKATFTDFGFSEKRWIAWWEANKTRHRIEWAVAALNHRIEEIRLMAISELKKMIGDAIEWPKGPLDHKQRREFKRRILQWWEREGRLLNPVAEID